MDTLKESISETDLENGLKREESLQNEANKLELNELQEANNKTDFENGLKHEESPQNEANKKLNEQQEEIKKDNSFDEWIEFFFPRKTHEIILTDEYLISAEESESRIILFLRVLGFTLLLIICGLFGFIKESLRNDQIIIYPEIIDPFDREFPDQHFVAILPNGTIVDFSLHDENSLSKGILFKLPFSGQYHGYSDSKGILYFIDGELRKDVVKYHKSFGKLGHSKIQLRPKEENVIYRLSATIGNKLWIFGKLKLALGLSPRVVVNTKVWYKSRQKLKKGPNLPNPFKDTIISRDFCTASLNQSHVIIIGFILFNDVPMKNKRVAILDYNLQKWTSLPSLEIPYENNLFNGCSGTVIQDKRGHNLRELLVHIQTIYGQTENWQTNSPLQSFVQVFDFANNNWKSLFMIPSTFQRIGLVHVTNGIVYSIMTDGTVIKHGDKGEKWNEVRSASLFFQDANSNVMIIPYLA